MFGFSLGEVLLIAAIALIAIGPKQLPEVARTLGRMINEFRRLGFDFQRSFLDARDGFDGAYRQFNESIEKSLSSASGGGQPAVAPAQPELTNHDPSPGETTSEAGPAEDDNQQLNFDIEKRET